MNESLWNDDLAARVSAMRAGKEAMLNMLVAFVQGLGQWADIPVEIRERVRREMAAIYVVTGGKLPPND